MARNTNIEILRILSMILIVMHHYSVHGGFILDPNTISLNKFLVQFLSAGGYLGVDCFILITGYFLIESSFKIEKLLKLLFVIFFYSASIYIIFLALGMIDFNIKMAIKSLFPTIFEKYWFATCYIILYIFSPYINALIRAIDKKQHFNLIIILLVIWSVIPTFTTAKLDLSSTCWFVTLYIIASYIRLYPNCWFENFGKNISIALASYSLILISIFIFDVLGLKFSTFGYQATYFTGMNKLPLLLCAVTLFLVFKNFQIRNNKLINTISSSMFGVYLIHDNNFVRDFLWLDLFKNQQFYHSPYLIVHAITVILSVFIICIIIDQIRYNFIEKPLFIFAKAPLEIMNAIKDKLP